jgi:hypothetical protein
MAMGRRVHAERAMVEVMATTYVGSWARFLRAVGNEAGQWASLVSGREMRGPNGSGRGEFMGGRLGCGTLGRVVYVSFSFLFFVFSFFSVSLVSFLFHFEFEIFFKNDLF